jgi:threonine/homoserine/homoserine lactone efflux protein
MDPSLAAFVALAFVLTITPGADMALILRNTLLRGRTAAMFTTLGIAVACSIHAMASSAGLSVILAQSATAYSIVKLVGAFYLIYLGVMTIRHARQASAEREAAAPRANGVPGSPRDPSVDAVRATKERRLRRSFVEGALTNLLNPKVAIFYLMVLPQFIPAGAPVLGRSMTLASIHIGMGTVWLAAYIVFINQLRGVLTAPRVRAWVERVTGGVLVALGLRLAIERRP